MRQRDSNVLFKLQAKLIETHVELAVNQAINQVVAQIKDLRHDVHREMGVLRQEIHVEMSGIKSEVHKMGNRLSCVETALGLRHQIRTEVRNRFFDYSFKAGWLMLGALLTYLTIHFRWLFH